MQEKTKHDKHYERGFVDGMQRQMQSSVDRAINRMTKEDIMKLAQEAISLKMEDHVWTMSTTHLERFAKLVRADERDACVQIIEEYRISGGNSVAGELAREWTYGALKEIRDDIRARGNI